MATIKPETLKLAADRPSETYHGTLYFTIAVEYIPRTVNQGAGKVKTATLEADVTVHREIPRGESHPRTEVRLSREWPQERELAQIGVTRISDLPGLRSLVLKAAEAHWAKFNATDVQIKKATDGKYDGLVTLALRGGYGREEFAVTITKLPFADYLFDGKLTMMLAEDQRIVAVSYTHTPDAVFEAKDVKDLHKYAVPSFYRHRIADMIQPILQRKLHDLAGERRKKKHEQLKADVKAADEHIEHLTAQLQRAKKDRRTATAALAEFEITT